MDIKDDYQKGFKGETMTHPNCHHQCSGNCRRVGCNCLCGEWHDKYEQDDETPDDINRKDGEYPNAYDERN